VSVVDSEKSPGLRDANDPPDPSSFALQKLLTRKNASQFSCFKMRCYSSSRASPASRRTDDSPPALRLVGTAVRVLYHPDRAPDQIAVRHSAGDTTGLFIGLVLAYRGDTMMDVLAQSSEEGRVSKLKLWLIIAPSSS
jgi:hypothetical protein